MRYLLLLGLLGLFALNVSAQECDYEVDKEDKFDGTIEQLTNPIIIARKVKRKKALDLPKVMAQLRNLDGDKFFVLKFPVTMVMTPTFKDGESEEGSKLILLLDNNERLELPLARLMNNQREKVEFRYASDFVLDASDIKTLKTHRITDIRVAMKNNNFDIELDKYGAGQLRDSFGCIE
ncbi:MAG: hypothetical protein GY810_26555 [Aureispira sp.]|nr:hypothetical protein [Aureispira sp.]